jgi:hypothetical protein
LNLYSLKKGETFRNYKELCSKLGIEWSSNRRKIDKIIGKYCDFHKEGHKIHIIEVYYNAIKEASSIPHSSREVYGIIYKIKNIINNKVYIGQTIRKNGFKDRYKHKGEGIERVYNTLEGSKKYGEPYNKHLYFSIKKYGFDSFDVIEEFDYAYSKEELNKKEMYWIKHYNATDENYGYNNTLGGDGHTIGKSAYLSKMGISMKPIYCSTINKVFLTTAEAAKDTGVGESSVRSVCIGNIIKTYSNIYKMNLEFDYIDLENQHRQPVICLTTGKLFRNFKEASKHYNINEGQILKHCKGKGKSAGRHPETNEKMIWVFALDYKIEDEFATI